MATQAISVGPATSILQNVVYALPARSSFITSSLDIETSLDGISWTPLTGATTGVNVGAIFVRCTIANAIVVCRNFISESSGGGGGGGGNPFDQDLNTTDPVTFSELTLTEGNIILPLGADLLISTITNPSDPGNNISLQAGNSAGDDGGEVILSGGNTDSGDGGNVDISSGYSIDGVGGSIGIAAGSGSDEGGSVSIRSGASPDTPGTVSIDSNGGVFINSILYVRITAPLRITGTIRMDTIAAPSGQTYKVVISDTGVLSSVPI